MGLADKEQLRVSQTARKLPCTPRTTLNIYAYTFAHCINSDRRDIGIGAFEPEFVCLSIENYVPINNFSERPKVETI
jgi:hypothetical protein